MHNVSRKTVYAQQAHAPETKHLGNNRLRNTCMFPKCFLQRACVYCISLKEIFRKRPITPYEHCTNHNKTPTQFFTPTPHSPINVRSTLGSSTPVTAQEASVREACARSRCARKACTMKRTTVPHDTEDDHGLLGDPPPEACRATQHTSASSLCAQPDSDFTGRVNIKCLVGLSPKPEEILMVELDRDATVGQFKNRLQVQLSASQHWQLKNPKQWHEWLQIGHL